MNFYLKCPCLKGGIILISLIIGIFLPSSVKEAGLIQVSLEDFKLATIEENTLLPIADLNTPESQPVQRIKVVVTGYSSTEDQTDLDPFITAAGTWVRDGIVANNFLKIGTKIRIPELYGDKIFIVEDRMHPTKGKYQIDIWFPDYWQALSFGAKRTYIEILEG